MKRIYLSLMFFLFFNYLFCQNFTLNGKYPFQEESLLEIMTINENEIILEYEDEAINQTVLDYTIQNIDGIPFLVLSNDMPKEVSAWWEFEKKTDIETNNKIMFLSFMLNNGNKRMFAFTKGFSMDRTPLTATRYDEWGALYKDCTSNLIEKTKSYPVDNLSKLVVDTPWVESAKEAGIGEGFTIRKASSGSLPKYLLLMNGYISYEKPYLYKQNNRIKKIKVTGLESGKSKILDVLDTPHPQTVDISFLTKPEDIRVEIADVYKGTKYDDTCLHYCITFNEEVIPYENSIEE